MMLSLEGIHAGYGRVEVLHGVDLVVPDGSAVALLGANGAGKTTLLRVAAGLLRPSDGRVVIDGADASHHATHQRAREGVCLIPEGRGIFRQLTVAENLAMFASGRNVDEAIDKAVAAFPVLGERLDQVAGTMSGGQQRMVAVTRALIVDAPFILADELSVGLAPVVIDEIFATVQVLRDQGRSLLVVEQYVDRALAIADYVYILHKGRVAFVGEPERCRDGDIFSHYLGSVA
jgi:branched-chain amino acid transport system ATP-binding protein